MVTVLTHRTFIAVVLVVQALCAFFLTADILSALLGLPIAPLNWSSSS